MLLRYEFKKLFSKSFVPVVILIFIILNALIFYNTQNKNNPNLINNIDRYHELNNKYSMDLESLKKFNKELSSYSYLSYIKNFKENEVEDTLEMLKKQDSEIVSKYDKSIYSKNDEALKRDVSLVKILTQQIEYINSYNDYLKNIEKQKDDMLSVSIFYKKGSFSYKNIVKTSEDFKHLKNLQVKSDIEEGIKSISNYYVADIIIIIISFILCISIFSYERETNIFLLIKANKNGRGPLIFSKILTLIISMLVLVIMLYGSLILIAYKLYGFGDLSRSIQSISEFRGCNIMMSVKTYLKVYLLTKALSSIIIAVIFALAFQLSKNIVKSYIFASVFLLVNFLCFNFIVPNSYINIFKYVNVFTFLLTPNLLGEYINVNIFGKPINLVLIYAIFNIGIVPMMIIINLILFIKEKEIKKQWIKFEYFNIIRKQISKKSIPSTLFFNEFYKLIFKNKLYLILILVFIVGYKNLHIINKIQYTDESVVYKNYISKVIGEINDKNKGYLEKEKLFFDNPNKLIEDLEFKLKNNQITEKQYESEERKILNKKKNVVAFNKVYNQYMYLNKLYKEKNIKGQFIDMEISDKLFNDKNKDLSKGIYISVLLIVFLSNIFANEYKSGAINLIKCSKNRNKVFSYKYLISFISIVILFLAVYVPDFVNVLKEYGTIYLKAPIQSIPIYFNLGLKLNILQFLILTNILKFIGILFIATILLNLSILSKNQLNTIILGTFILIPSIILSVIGIDFLEKVSFVNIFNLNSSFSLKKGLFYNISYFLVLAIFTTFMQYITFNVYRNKKILEKRWYNEAGDKGVK